MSIKEQLRTEIEKLSEEQLALVYQFVQTLLQGQPTVQPSNAGSLLFELSKIHIDAPEDFSENWERYLHD